MANKRNSANSAKYKSITKVPSEAPLFDEEVIVEKENQNTSAISDDEILKEIQTVMAEGTYNKDQAPENDEIEDETTKTFVTNDIPLANREKKKDLPNNSKQSKKLTAEEKKARKEAKKAAYKKTTLKHKIKVMAVLMVLGIFTGSGLGVWYYNFVLKSNVDYSGNPADYVQSVDETLAKYFSGLNLSDKENWVEYAQNQGKTPLDLSPVDNIVLAEYNATIANSYTAIGEGLIKTMGQNQKLYSERKFDGNKYSFVSISPSTLPALVKDVAVCDIMEKGAKGEKAIKSYAGPILEGDKSANWKYVTAYSAENYSYETGVAITDLQPYLICGKEGYNTVTKSSEITVDENGNYVFTIELDVVNSVLKYIRQVKRTGGLASYPEFDYIKQTYTMNSDWQILNVAVEEEYWATKMGAKPLIHAEIVTNFTYNEPVTLPNVPSAE